METKLPGETAPPAWPWAGALEGDAPGNLGGEGGWGVFLQGGSDSPVGQEVGGGRPAEERVFAGESV